jgi:hypothetical protein
LLLINPLVTPKNTERPDATSPKPQHEPHRVAENQVILVSVIFQLGNATALRVDGGCVIPDDEFLLLDDCVFVFHEAPRKKVVTGTLPGAPVDCITTFNR